MERDEPAIDGSRPAAGQGSAGHPGWWALAGVVLVLAGYIPAIDAPFFYLDDYQYVAGNSALQHVPLARPWEIFTGKTNPWEYLPVRDLSYRIDLALFGLCSAGFRIHNLVLYALCCAAVWGSARAVHRILRPGGDAGPEGRLGGGWFAAWVTVLFAAHPAHVESVAWIAGRKDVLSGLFAFLSFWMFLEGTCHVRPSRGRLLVSYLLFLLAILSKSSVAAMPAAAFLLAVAEEGRVRRGARVLCRPALAAAPLAVLAAVSVGLQVFGSETSALPPGATAGLSGSAGAWDLPARILGTLTRIALVPLRLRLAYDVGQPGWAGGAVAMLGWLAAAAALAGAWETIRRRTAAGYGAAFFGVLCLPFLQLIPFNTWSYASERFLFLPVAGLAMVVAGWTCAGPARRRAALGMGLFLAGTGLTFLRAREWSSGPALLHSSAMRCPAHGGVARFTIHYVLLKESQFAEARAVASRVRIPAERLFLETYVDAAQALHEGNLARVREVGVRLFAAAPPEDRAVRTDIANLVMESGLYAEAESAYRALLAEAEDSGEIRYNLGLSLARQGRPAEAAGAIRTAIDGGFVSADAWNNLALAERDAGRTQAAEAAFRAALDTDPRHWHAAYNLGRLLLGAGDRAGAGQALSTARARALANGDSTVPIDRLLRRLDPR